MGSTVNLMQISAQDWNNADGKRRALEKFSFPNGVKDIPIDIIILEIIAIGSAYIQFLGVPGSPSIRSKDKICLCGHLSLSIIAIIIQLH